MTDATAPRVPPTAGQAASPDMPDIAWIRLSSVTSAAENFAANDTARDTSPTSGSRAMQHLGHFIDGDDDHGEPLAVRRSRNRPWTIGFRGRGSMPRVGSYSISTSGPHRQQFANDDLLLVDHPRRFAQPACVASVGSVDAGRNQVLVVDRDLGGPGPRRRDRPVRSATCGRVMLSRQFQMPSTSPCSLRTFGHQRYAMPDSRRWAKVIVTSSPLRRSWPDVGLQTGRTGFRRLRPPGPDEAVEPQHLALATSKVASRQGGRKTGPSTRRATWPVSTLRGVAAQVGGRGRSSLRDLVLVRPRRWVERCRDLRPVAQRS